MCTETHHAGRPRPGQRRTRAVLLALALSAGTAMPALGQSTATDSNPPPAGAGQGQGFHSPQSAFPPLQDLPGVVPWRLLGTVTMKQEGRRTVAVFPPPVASLSGTRVKVQGFMMPLQPGERQTHFLLSAVPTTCGFCRMEASPVWLCICAVKRIISAACALAFNVGAAATTVVGPEAAETGTAIGTTDCCC